MGRKPNLKLIPTCLATHEEGPDCDGDPKATGNASIPCSWRRRCLGLKAHLEETGDDDEQYIQLVKIKSKVVRERTGWKRTAQPVGRTHDEFKLFCSSLAARYDIERQPDKPNQPSTRPKDKSAPRAKGKAHGNKYSSDKVRKRAIKRIMAAFCFALREETGRNLTLGSRGGKLVLPGSLYALNRLEKSGYISIYCRLVRREFGAKAQDTAVASLYPRYRTKTLDIRINADVRDVQRVLGSDLSITFDPQPVRDGAFKTVCKRLDEDRARELALSIAKLIGEGILDLPLR